MEGCVPLPMPPLPPVTPLLYPPPVALYRGHDVVNKNFLGNFSNFF